MHETSQANAELEHERDYVDGLYSRLDELRAEKAQQLAEVRRTQAAGSHQNRSERDAFATMYEDRLAQLNAVDDRLVFGRLDLDADIDAQDAETEEKVAKTDASNEKLVKALGFNEVPIAAVKDVRRFIAKIEADTGLKGAEAFVEFCRGQ